MDEMPQEMPRYEEPDTGFDIRRHWDVVQRRYWAIIACVVVCLTFAIVHLFRAKPVYVAAARLLLERKTPQGTPFDVSSDYRSEASFNTQIRLITSKDVMLGALQDEKVTRLFPMPSELPAPQAGFFAALSREWASVFGPPALPPDPWERLAASFEVRSVKDTNLVEVRAAGPNPERNTLIANAVGKAFVAYSVEMRKKFASDTFTMLQGPKGEQEAALSKAEDEVQAFREQATLVESLSAAGAGFPLDRIKLLNAELYKIQLRRVELSATAEAVQQADKDSDDVRRFLTLPVIHGAPIVKETYDRLMRAKLDLLDATASLGEKHPNVIAASVRAASIEAQLREVIATAVESIETEYPLLLQREKDFTAALNDENKLAVELTRKSGHYNRLQRDVERQAHVFSVIVDKMKEADLSKDVGFTNVSLIERASVPKAPESRRALRIIGLGAFLGLFLGLGLAHVLERLDDTIKAPDDLEKRLGLGLLGTIPMIPDDPEGDTPTNRATYSQHAPFSGVAEAFRSLRTNVYFSRSDLRTILVTSAVTEEGKSLVVANLAICMAQDGKRVLLVDADLRRPMLHSAFGLNAKPGLTDHLIHGTPIEQLAQTFSVQRADADELEKLHVLTSGTHCPNPAELLGSEGMTRFMQQASRQYDIVILDSCPVLAVADTALLAARCDGTLFITRAETSSREATEHAVKQVLAVRGKLLGGVLNGLRSFGRGGYYHYYHYGKYGHPYGSKHEGVA